MHTKSKKTLYTLFLSRLSRGGRAPAHRLPSRVRSRQSAHVPPVAKVDKVGTKVPILYAEPIHNHISMHGDGRCAE